MINATTKEKTTRDVEIEGMRVGSCMLSQGGGDGGTTGRLELPGDCTPSLHPYTPWYTLFAASTA